MYCDLSSRAVFLFVRIDFKLQFQDDDLGSWGLFDSIGDPSASAIRVKYSKLNRVTIAVVILGVPWASTSVQLTKKVRFVAYFFLSELH